MKTESYNITKVAGSDTEGIEIFAMQDGDQSNVVRTGPEQPGNISFGNLSISKILFGSNEVSKIFLGNILLYEGSDLPDNAILDSDGGYIKASDGYLTTTEVQSPTLISFTLSETPYQAEDGMTWGEWVDSEYNTGGFEIVTNEYNQETVGIPSENTIYVSNIQGDVHLNDVINNEYYYLGHHGGSND